MQYCSLQHRILLLSPVTSRTGCCFCFGPISLLFLELFLHWTPVAYWARTHLGSSSFSVLSFPFHTVHGVLKARILKWLAIPFSSGPHFVWTLHHDLSVLGGPKRHGTQFHWARQGCGPCDQMVSFLWLWFSVCLPSDGEKAMTTHSSTLAWQIPWTEEPGGLQSIGSLGVEHDWVTSLSLFTFMRWRRKCQPTLVFLPGKSQEQGSLVGCHLWGHTELDMTDVT